MSSATSPIAALNIRSVSYFSAGQPVERTAAEELARFAGLTSTAASRPGKGVNVSLASRKWARVTGAPATGAWFWMRITDAGAGEIISNEPAFLFGAVRLLANGLSNVSRAKLERGVLITAPFDPNRPISDSCLTQYWRTARKFEPEQYIATLAESGFTHLEVN